MVTPFIPGTKPVSIKSAEPLIPVPNAKRTIIKYGPFRLRAPGGAREGNFMSLDPQGTSFAYMAQDFPSNITILVPKFVISLEDGQEISNANKVYNHHAFLYDVSRGTRANVKCKGTNKDLAAVNALMGSSADFTPDSLQVSLNFSDPNRLKIGNYVGSNKNLFLSADLVNYNPEPKNVYVSADITYLEGKPPGYWETAVHLISVGTCESNDLLGNTFVRPPVGKAQWQLKGEVVVKDDGKITAIRGHMHGEWWPITNLVYACLVPH